VIEVAEEQPDFPGNHFDSGAYTLDLYRLLCMVMADECLARLRGTSSSSISRLRDEYLYNEVKRTLISSAAALRVWLDQHPPDAFADMKTNCGTLYPNWPQKKKKFEVLSLREACNKIIHATALNEDLIVPDRAHNPDYEGVYLRPHLYLYGAKGKRTWRAKLSIVDFVKWGTAVFWRWGREGRA
jgi:hypothetical protein